MKLEYIPFIKLINPYVLANNAWSSSSIDSIPLCNSRALKTIRSDDIKALSLSIKQFGLLNPLLVWKIPKEEIENIKNSESFSFRGKFRIDEYAIIDGQRRYFAIQKMFGLRTANEIENASHRVRTGAITFVLGENGKMKEKNKPKTIIVPILEEHILIPCIVYDYKHLSECIRHSIEDNKFSVRPSQIYLECAERMGDNLPDMMPKDFRKIIDIRNKITKIFSELQNKHLKEEEKERKKEQVEELKRRLKEIRETAK